MRFVSLLISRSLNISLTIWTIHDLFARKYKLHVSLDIEFSTIWKLGAQTKLKIIASSLRRWRRWLVSTVACTVLHIPRINVCIYPSLFHFKQACLVRSGTRVPIVIVVGIFRLLISSRGELAFHFLRDKRRGRIPGGISGMRVRTDRPQTRQVEVCLLAIRPISRNDCIAPLFCYKRTRKFLFNVRPLIVLYHNKSIVTRIKSWIQKCP